MDINKTARGRVLSATAGTNSNQMSETPLNEVNTQHALPGSKIKVKDRRLIFVRSSMWHDYDFSFKSGNLMWIQCRGQVWGKAHEQAIIILTAVDTSPNMSW